MESILQNKKISVCMATYNGEKYLKKQLDSVLKNLTECDELIISDDGSSDRSVRILTEYAQKYKQIRILKGPQRGVVKNFENALQNVNGEFVFLCDQDDEWEEDKVKMVIEQFELNKDICLIIHDAVVIDSNGKKINSSFFSIRSSKSGFIKNIYKNSYIGCCMAFKKQLLDCILPIPEKVEMHDWWIGLLAECEGKSLFINDKLIKYRRHENNVSKMEHYGLSRMIKNRCVMLFYIIKRRLKID